ncbi:hypothetical protein C900_00269 [Fulvivirga imtechensis AK7]|uniref:Uncharacterized protein n=1 Tax=Fulvivirga imtechensis AK7 TaxID=1237149 RepID=L8JJU4_9BACT|nr:hypothetical protein C900_00269 [Fulvivirga imtechensis AK7]
MDNILVDPFENPSCSLVKKSSSKKLSHLEVANNFLVDFVDNDKLTDRP